MASLPGIRREIPESAGELTARDLVGYHNELPGKILIGKKSSRYFTGELPVNFQFSG